MDEIFFKEARQGFHAALLKSVLRKSDKGIPSNADGSNKTSIKLALGIMERLGPESIGARLAGQMSGNKFEIICKEYIEETFPRLRHIRPGQWKIGKGLGGRLGIAQYEQYQHLAELEALSRQNPELSAALGSDYLIKPDVVVIRSPENDETINAQGLLVGADEARLSPLRLVNNTLPILHASVSCKWTLRSDRAQNARSEGLNLVRNRKGRLPHVVVVTGEPSPSRIASIALGTGDVDCVYHFALDELRDTASAIGADDAADLLRLMVDGKRLKDISDLPLDLAI